MAITETYEQWKDRTKKEPKKLKVGESGCKLFEYAGKFVKYPNLKNESMKARKEMRAILIELKDQEL